MRIQFRIKNNKKRVVILCDTCGQPVSLSSGIVFGFWRENGDDVYVAHNRECDPTRSDERYIYSRRLLWVLKEIVDSANRDARQLESRNSVN